MFLFALFASSCSEDEIVKNQSTSSTSKLFTASFEQGESRTYIEEGNLLRWTEGDQISLFDGNTLNRQYQFDGETGDNAGTFSVVDKPYGTGNDLRANYAIYPYEKDIKITEDGVITATLPAEQSYAVNSFGLGHNTMVAVTKDTDDTFLKFKNVCGYLKLQLYGDNVTVKSITLTGNNNEKLASKATITAVYGGEPTINMADDATKTITLDCGKDGVKIGSTAKEATAFWVVVPPTTFESGIEITITDINGNTFAKSTSNEIIIDRNIIKPMTAFEVEIGTIPNNQIWYTATAKVVPNKVSDYYWSSYYDIVSNEWNETTGKGVITFRSNVTSIGGHAFSDKSVLKSIILPNTITYIDDYAFEDCSRLVSIAIPDNVRSIGIRAFKDCISLEEFKGKFASEDGNCLIVNGVLNSFAPVGITEYTIPNSVKEIGVWVFNSCSNLKSIIIPESVTKIGEGAFAYCYGLTNIMIPNGVTEIGNYAFFYCNNLDDIYIKCTTSPSIEDDAFKTYGNEEVKIYVPKDNVVSYLNASCWSNYLSNLIAYDFEKGESTPIGFNTISYTATSKVELDSSADFGATIVSNNWDSTTGNGIISFDGVITSIGEKAFNYCSNLTSITIPETITYIGKYAFEGCSSLISMTIPNSVTKIGEYAFYDCTGELLVNCNISQYAFYNAKITKVTIGEGVQVIDNCSFSNCSSLTNITIPNSVTKIGERAFYGCSSLTNITLPHSITGISKETFFRCSKLASVTIPNSVTEIGENAFYECSSLTSVTIPNSVTKIGGYAFFYCTGELLVNCNIPQDAFSYAKFTKVIIGDGVDKIGNSAFRNCSNLTSITLPNTVTSIDDYAFGNCSSLASISIPYSVTEIPESCFHNCSSLTSITIPDGVTKLGEGAFNGCSSLQEFKSKYASADGRCIIFDGVLNAFAPAGLTEYTIPLEVTEIGRWSLAYCSNIEKLTLSQNVTSVGYGALAYFTGELIVNSNNIKVDSYYNQMTKLTFGNSVVSIGNYNFANLNYLTSVVISKNITSIGGEAFKGCKGLTSIYIKSTTPPSLGNDAFNGHASDRKIYVPSAAVDKYKKAYTWKNYADFIFADPTED